MPSYLMNSNHYVAGYLLVATVTFQAAMHKVCKDLVQN